jgi:hypothetical protein
LMAVVRPKLPTENSDEPMALRIGMPLASMRPGTIRKPPPTPKKPDTAPDKDYDRMVARETLRAVVANYEPDCDQAYHDPARHANIRVTRGRARTQHRDTHRNHRKREQEQQLLTVDELSKCRTNGSANNTGKGKSHGTGPFDIAGTPMTEQVGKSICGDGKGARADGDVWVTDVNDVEEERHSKIEPPPPINPSENPTAPPESTASAS